MNRSRLHLKLPKHTLRHKLFLYTFAMAILLLALLATLLILLGRFRTPKDVGGCDHPDRRISVRA